MKKKLNSLVRSELLDCLELFDIEQGWCRTAINDVDRELIQLGIDRGLIKDVSPKQGSYRESFWLTLSGRLFLNKTKEGRDE